MISKIAFVALLTINCSVAQSQSRKFFLDAGLIARTTIFYHSGTSGLPSGPSINADAPYDYRAGVNGTGLNLSLGFNACDIINLHYGVTLRYDFFHFNEDGDSRTNTIYIDQTFVLTRHLNKRIYVGAGFTMYNLGKELNYSSDGISKTLDLSFNSWDLLAGISVWRLYVEPKVSIVSEGFPGTIKDNATLLGCRILYRWDL